MKLWGDSGQWGHSDRYHRPLVLVKDDEKYMDKLFRKLI